MKAIVIVMSILGCDDNGTSCVPVASVDHQWVSISACDADSEKELAKYTKVHSPTVVAVCQTADSTALSDSEDDMAAAKANLAQNKEVVAKSDNKQSIMTRAISLVKSVIPSKQLVVSVLEKPVHVVTGTYSWVARKIHP
jgi:exopolysaccharide biosynthesis protein